MNPKIKEFAEQAKASVPAGLLVNEWIDEYNRIFAELIVKECVSISEQYDKGLSENDVECFTCRKVAYTISDRMQKHFGVEE